MHQTHIFFFEKIKHTSAQTFAGNGEVWQSSQSNTSTWTKYGAFSLLFKMTPSWGGILFAGGIIIKTKQINKKTNASYCETTTTLTAQYDDPSL